ncbi:serine/threonine protein kinase [Streptomyces sp. NBC_00683]|nr:serine/threonine-protein kinase [Streptomyces sp. NBC_00683]
MSCCTTSKAPGIGGGAVTRARIGDYVIVREIGSGGMGSVYLGRSRGGREVAIKVIRPEYAADPRYRTRFRKEVEAARRVGGFHTAAVVDADPDAPEPWMASAFVKGPTLADEIRQRGPLGEARLWALAAALAEALEAIHSCGLVHRDLKPANIVLAEDGPRVLDFGIARPLEGTRLTVDGGVIGTPGFVAPEQVQGHRDITGACDVFALGAVLVAAAGGSAFGHGEAYGQMYAAVHTEADTSAVPKALQPLVRACLHKNPEQRPSPRLLLDLCANGGADDHTAPVPDGSAHAPTETATRPAPPPVPPGLSPVAVYQRDPKDWNRQVLRNLLYILLLVALTTLNITVFHLPDAVTGLSVFGVFLVLIRFIGLTSTGKERLLVNDLGIGVGAPDNLIVLRWSGIAALELDAEEAWLTLRLNSGQQLPMGFQHPTWVLAREAKGFTRIHTGLLHPAAEAPPLSDTLRALASRHGVPLTGPRSD